MKKIGTLFLILVSIINSYAQLDPQNLEEFIYSKPDSIVKLINSKINNLPQNDDYFRLQIIKIKANYLTGRLELLEPIIDSIVKDCSNNKIKLEAEYLRGVVLLANGQFNEGVDHYKQLLTQAEKIDDTVMIGKVASAIGVNEIRLENFDSAIVYVKKSLSINLSNNDSAYIAEDYNLLGSCYTELSIVNEAISFYRKAFRYKPVGPLVGNLNMNLAVNYSKLYELDSALYYGKKALKVFEYYNRIASQINIKFLLADAYEGNQQFDKALNLKKDALEMAISTKDRNAEAIGSNNLSTSYLFRGEGVTALKLARNAYSLGLDLENIKYQIHSSENIAFAHAVLGNYDSSRHYAGISDTLSKKYYQKSYEENLATIQGELQLAKEKSISQKLAKEAAEAKLVVADKNKWIGLLLALILLITLIFFSIFQLKKRKAQAEKDALIIAERDRGTQAIFDAQEEERKRISRDLHDGVGQQLSGIKMAFHRIAKRLNENDLEQKEEMEELAQVIADSADEVRSISHQMMPRILTEVGLVEALQGMLEKSLKLSGIKYDFEHFGIDKRLPENLEIGLYRVCQELINNIIKHSGARQVNVQLVKNQKNILLLVEDNGKGIKVGNSDGHGLLNMKSRVNTMNGEINLEPSPTSGTLATVRIPIT